MGMLLFRGALEGAYYIIVSLSFVALFALGVEYTATGGTSENLVSIGNVLYSLIDKAGPVGTIMFLIGATCIYVSFYRTKLIPRWLTIWGFIGVVPYMLYAILHFFGLDNGIGFYLQMVLAPQEMVMAVWLIVKGFNSEAVKKLLTENTTV